MLYYAANKLLAWRRRQVAETPVIYYWPARGRGEAVRLALAAAGVEFSNAYTDMAMFQDQEMKTAMIMHGRANGGNSTTNVPMLYMDGQYLTQSMAVLKYVGRKFGLYPEGDIALSYQLDNLIEAANDLRTANYKPSKLFGGGEKEKATYIDEALPKHLGNFARLLGEQVWFAGGRLTIADLTIYDTLDVANRQAPGCLAKYPTLEAFHRRVEAVPGVAKWLNAEERTKLMAFPAL